MNEVSAKKEPSTTAMPTVKVENQTVFGIDFGKLQRQVWLDAYRANYNGESPEAKELEKFLKGNYQGNNYIPWATMERLVYQQDPDAVFEVLDRNPSYDDGGGILHPQRYQIYTKQAAAEVTATVVVNFVKVAVTFLGKRIVEHYPVQDQTYGAPKAVDQNMVNKAIKRALAKAASRASGLALKLYENGDLQFDEPIDGNKKPLVKKPTTEKTADALKSMDATTNDVKAPVEEEKAPVVKKAPVKAAPKQLVVEPEPEEAPEVEESYEVEDSGDPVDVEEAPTDDVPEVADDPISQLVHLITGSKDVERNKRIDMVLKNFNPSLKKTYNFEISTASNPKELAKNLEKVLDPTKLLKALERVLS